MMFRHERCVVVFVATALLQCRSVDRRICAPEVDADSAQPQLENFNLMKIAQP